MFCGIQIFIAVFAQFLHQTIFIQLNSLNIFKDYFSEIGFNIIFPFTSTHSKLYLSLTTHDIILARFIVLAIQVLRGNYKLYNIMGRVHTLELLFIQYREKSEIREAPNYKLLAEGYKL
jgi:hypothetical protein